MSKVQQSKGFKWLLIISGLFLLPGLVMLGWWQLDRAEEKRRLIDSWQTGSYEIGLPSQSAALKGGYRKTQIKVMLDKRRYFLLDNRTRRGRAGYEVVAVATTNQQQRLLVNLGWVAASVNREVLPRVVIPDGELMLKGGLRRLTGTFRVGEEFVTTGWPKRVQSLEQGAVADLLGNDVVPYELQLDTALIGGLDLNWAVTTLTPTKHLGYAVQWFAMALALLVWLGFAAVKLRREVRYE